MKLRKLIKNKYKTHKKDTANKANKCKINENIQSKGK